MSGLAVKTYLRKLISDMDAGKSPKRAAPRWVRTFAVPAAAGLTIGLAGATGCVTSEPGGGDPVTREMAADAKADGFTDWLCEAVGAEPGCDICEELEWYGDGICDEFCDQPDLDCGAPPVALYMAPMPEEETGDMCSDGVDNDGDDLVDCADPDCGCSVAMYMAPMPEPETGDMCDDGLDNDADGLVDCDDPDCMCAVPMYMAPLPEEETGDMCDDGLDNDGDGLVDCDDPDCECMAPLYAAPMA